MIVNYKNKEILYDLYVNKQYSSTQISKMAGVAPGTIAYTLHKNNIPIRPISIRNHLYRTNHCKLSSKFLDFIYGELLGDMSLYTPSGYSAGIKYASKHEEYIYWLSDCLKEFGIERSGRIIVRIINNRKYYHYVSKTYSELMEVRTLFYPNGKKVIPQSLDFNPILLRQWYIGDGSLCWPCGNRSNNIMICTAGFKKGDVIKAINKINALGIKASYARAANSIYITTYSTVDFLDYIGPCPVECYQYKWAIKNRINQLEMPLKN